MLKIQRASAGSGKTFALSQNYIINLIAYKDQTGLWKLRNSRQIEDALSHILAITFTNKATNEMKQRIIDNLSILAEASGKETITKDFIENTPHLKKIHKLVGASYQEIGNAAKVALNTILNNFSIFKISTIDSFFQEILRTFTYEANINDAYQLEIDASYINDAAIASAIHAIDSKPEEMGNSAFWLKILIGNEARSSQKWNFFNKKASNGSIYAKIKFALSQLQKEKFLEIKNIIDNYCAEQTHSDRLLNFYKDFKNKAYFERENHLKHLHSAIDAIEDILLRDHYTPDKLNKNFLSHLRQVKSLSPDDTIEFAYNKILSDQSVLLKKYRKEGNDLDKAAMDFYALVDEWKVPSPTSLFSLWNIYNNLIPYLGLIIEIRYYISEVLESNNTILLSDTGYILKRIIGQEDAPFVYERLGNRIENYLIDEFQDTSALQWEIIYPLLNESESKDSASLIIGDPKQSIYRFRNANHRLITEVVPKAFPSHQKGGFSVEENTNWRSDNDIVRFNNYFFKNLALSTHGLSILNGQGYDIPQLYSNVVQNPHHKEIRGYVEIRGFRQNESENNDKRSLYSKDSTDTDWYEEMVKNNLGPLISTLIQRGYRPGDIGILVNTNDNGKLIVNSLISYNESLTDNESKIEFISEEALLISSSSAVKQIIGILEKLANPFAKPVKLEEQTEQKEANGEIRKKRKDRISWNQIKLNYNLFSLNHPELSATEKIISFFDSEEFNSSFNSFIDSIELPSLASIVEESISLFLDARIKEKESVYLISFQDLIYDYSQNHQNDPASFLEWWKAKGIDAAITSPSGMDAVQIMTIHKSKGLEFKCVIIPFATDNLMPGQKKVEWRWAYTPKSADLDFPEVLPVETLPTLNGTIHENIYREYFDQVLIDRINMYYVALTRARNELYIFTKVPGKSSGHIYDYIFDILTTEEVLRNSDDSEENLIDSERINFRNEEECYVITYGNPLSRKEIANIYTGKSPEPELIDLTGYYVNTRRPRLKSRASKLNPSGEPI